MTGDVRRAVAVHPIHGGKGVASALINTVVDTLAADGARSIALTTHVEMPSNVALYTH